MLVTLGRATYGVKYAELFKIILEKTLVDEILPWPIVSDNHFNTNQMLS